MYVNVCLCMYVYICIVYLSHMIFIFFFVLIVHYPTRSEYVISQDEFSESFLYYMKNEETISGSVRKQDSSSNSSSGSSSSGTSSSCRDNEERMIIEPNSVVLLTDIGERLENNFVFHVPDGGKLLSVRYHRYQIPKRRGS